MFHLSKELTGIVLPVDKYGSHLSNGKTIDLELEQQNFEFAGNLLCETWNTLKIDGYDVVSEYIKAPPKASTLNYKCSSTYKMKHLIETQYFTAVLKCDERQCCGRMETSVSAYFPNRRVPALIPINFTIQGPKAIVRSPDIYKQHLQFPSLPNRIVLEKSLLETDVIDKYRGNVPYDYFFPTVMESLDDRLCPYCFRWNGTKKSLKEHLVVCEQKPPTTRRVPKRRKLLTAANSLRRKARKNNIIEDSDSNDTPPSNSDSGEESDSIWSDPEDTELDRDEDYESSGPDSDFSEADLPPPCSITDDMDIEVITNIGEWIDVPWSQCNK